MLGISLALIAATFSGIALFLQKSGLKKIEKPLDAIKSKEWIIGTVLLLISFIFYISSLRIEKLVIIQPILNFSIIVLIFLESFVSKYKLTKHEMLSLTLFLVGVILMQV